MKQPRLTYLFLTFLLALLSASCKKDSLPAPAAEEEESGSGVYVSVVVNTQEESGSRADGATDDYNPTGGEKGDGEQAGVGEENMVHDLTLFFLNKTLNEATEICASAYFDEKDITPAASGSITRYTVQREIEGLFVGNKYHVVAIVNAGNLTNVITDIDGLKNHQFREVIDDTHGSERWFLMASEKDSEEIEIRANNSQYNPTWVNVYVERMTARVDCAWKESYEIGDNMPSEGEEQSPGEKDVVKILGAALVNRYRSGTYAFKRVTNGTDLDNYTIDYLGDEKTNNDDNKASNYVLDSKTIGGKNSGDYTYYYTEYVDWDVDNDFRDPTNGNVTSNGDRTYYLLDYTRENINTEFRLSEEEGVERYATGIMFKAQYKPAGFTEGVTFYRYTASDGGTPTLYTAEALKEAFPETFDDANQSSWGDIEGCDVFLNGWCYYIYWIRHADDGDVSKISPMEYAIVRNNIYQLYVNSVSQLGTPEPDSNVEEFDTEIHIQVKGWVSIGVRVPDFD